MKLLAVLVILGCVSESWQWCFSHHCPHQTDLPGCVQGTYTCGADQICQIETHLEHGNAPWVLMHCSGGAELANCLTKQEANDPNCDPTNHDYVCHWCCETEQCVRDLANGTISQPPGASTTAATMASTTAATMASSTQTIPADSTTATAACVDEYLGDCSVDFAGRCAEPLVQDMCKRFCNLCSN